MTRSRLVEESASILRTNDWSLAVAESVTVGHVQAAIGGLSGASDFFAGGVTAYNLEQKVEHLGVDRETAERCDCVSAEVAWQMARGVGHLFSSSIAVATTGYAEPYPERKVETPFAFIAVWSRRLPEKVTTQKVLAPSSVNALPVTSGHGEFIEGDSLGSDSFEGDGIQAGAIRSDSPLNDVSQDANRPNRAAALDRLDWAGDPRRSCQAYFAKLALEAVLQFLRDATKQSSG